eukprot:CAMPEP_0177608602 /NCGR_PEP_ID=MMETSP0419_2-20121207/18564_1 /TAXON_ID=582737 /ORGANISM="Tetraselmis sp., Strain GSL018" /LENGTH=128 /DNA_ID=CAMNT_0019103313 /DNA_START=1694 /DNA_END=2076 /DNA_ORIENTATION=-
MALERFVGLDKLIREIDLALAKPENRVVLSGPPGCGKSSLGRAYLLDRGFNTTDATEHDVDRTRKVIRDIVYRSFSGGTVQDMLNERPTTGKRSAIWVDDSVSIIPGALEAQIAICAHPKSNAFVMAA